ncbi:CDP-glycerol glycerophosphotransferase family protein [Pseudoalteromonas phenolica]|nr:CDP-glycerol glycerophosphotransferase family protein [Pseudoalteromonas phenolica]
MLKNLIGLVFKVYAYIISRFLKREYIVFYSKHGYVDNPKYLFRFCLENGLKCVWIQIGKKGDAEVRALKQSYDFVLLTKKNILKSQYYIARAKYVFVSHSFFDIGSFIQKTTQVVNLWHGVALKKMGYDSEVDVNGFLSTLKENPYTNNDFVIVANEYSKEHMVSCMQLSPDRVLNLGQPRNDVLLESKTKRPLEKSINQTTSFLYAPTFRGDESKALSIYRSIIESFEKFAPMDSNLVLRLHPNEAHLVQKITYSNRVKLSNTEDIQEELLASDVLISDYSSVVFDFALTEKPVILFVPDKNEYFKERTGFYFEFDILFEGVSIAESIEEMKWSKGYDAVQYEKLIKLNHTTPSCEKIFQYFNLRQV